MVEPFTREHVDAVANLHHSSLTGLLRDLGLGSIKAFYIGAIKSDYAIAFVVIEQGILQGFVFGSTSPQILKRDVLRNNFFQILFYICLGVLRNPSTLTSLLHSIRGGEKDAYDVKSAELTYLAVKENYRSAGIGHQLANKFTQTIVGQGISAYELSVDADNTKAIKFYQRLNFLLVGEYREWGIKHFRFRLDLS